jgi:ketosteroid isomerase-like protein
VSLENTEVVKRGQEARSAGRIVEWIDTLDPNIEWDITKHPMPDFPLTGRGRREFVAHVTRYWSRWNDYGQTVQKTFDVGDDVVVILHETARLRNCDEQIERDVATIWTIENGKRVRFRAFEKPDDALQAAGLKE